MKTKVLTYLWLSIAAIFWGHVACATDYVIISEVMYDTPLNEDTTLSPHNYGEFVEIYNAHPELSVNLQGWQLQTISPIQTYTFPDILLPPASFLVVAYGTPRAYELTSVNDGAWTDFHTIYECYCEDCFGLKDTMSVVFQSTLILPNDSCKLRLIDAAGQTRDSIHYGELSYVSNCNKHALNESCTNVESCTWCAKYSLRRTSVDFNIDGSSTFKRYEWIGHCSSGDPSGDDPEWTCHNTPGCSEQPIRCNVLPVNYANTTPSVRNYIRQITPLQEIDTIPNYALMDSVPHALNTITWYDALGRPIQSVQKNFTPTGKHLTTRTEYNAFGRVTKEWLPGITESVEPYPIGTFKSVSSTTYNGDTAAYKAYQYSTQVLGNDILSSALEATRQPGNDMIGHMAHQKRGTNTEQEVRLFKVSDLGDLIADGYYAPLALTYDSLTDEDSKNVTTYKNKIDQVVLTRIAGNTDTYRVYDRMGRLAYILPPNLVDSIALHDTILLSDGRLKRWAYCYQYDSRGNQKFKRLPGCEPIRMIYDKANRLVLSQDGNMRDKGDGTWWMVYTYDLFGRLLYTYYAPTSCAPTDLEGLQQELVTASRTSNITYGYTNNWFPSQMKLLRVYYYDDYTFLNLLSATQRDSLTYAPLTGFGTKEASSVGRLTGERIYNLADDDYVTQVYYYDSRGQIVQSKASNLLGGYNKAWYNLGFAGNILQELRTHSDDSGETIRELYTYTYDHSNRLKDTYYQFRNEPEVILSSNIYDELGQVRQCLTHGIMLNQARVFADTAHYDYNIRNQLTHMKQYGFEENLYYTTASPIQGTNPTYYNGNIGSRIWSYGVRRNGYEYFYDNHNRLSSTYGIVNNQWADNMYQESFSYDKQGNIQQLWRMSAENGFAPDLDYLNYTYNGNQVVSIADIFTPSGQTGVLEYANLSNGQNEMIYDKNGALTADFDRNICAIRNNILSLPDTIQFVNGNQIVHRYDAMGRKLQTTYYRKRVQGSVTDYIISAEYYNENICYTRPTWNNGRYLHRVNNPEGCMWYLASNGEHYPIYYVRDYQGTIRESYIIPEGVSAQVLQRLQYYPSGLRWKENIGLQEDQPYRYNGKEWVDAFGLDEYDSQARWFYPAIMRTTTMDPHAEEYPETSPYAWCANNPVRFVDEDGRDWYEDTIKTIRWTDYTSQRQMNDAGIVGTYLGEAVVIFNGSEDEHWGSDYTLNSNDAKPANVTIYGINHADDLVSYPGMTIPQNDSYSTLDAGVYRAYYQDMATSVYGTVGARKKGYPEALTYRIRALQESDNLWGSNNGHRVQMKDVFLHRTDWNGSAKSASKGCLIIDGTRWRQVEQQLRKSQNIFIKVFR